MSRRKIIRNNTPPLSCHESKKLNALLGKRVEVVFFDGSVRVGVLGKSEPPHIKGYTLGGNLHFRKTHIKKIMEV